MSKECIRCKNAVELIGAYTSCRYIECKLEQEFAEKATEEELKEVLRSNERPWCKYCEGKPKFGGVTFDD